MKKILNTFKDGSTKTKAYLILAIVSGFATVGFIIAALIVSELLLFFGAVICAFICISLVQSFGISALEDEPPAPPVVVQDGMVGNVSEEGKAVVPAMQEPEKTVVKESAKPVVEEPVAEQPVVEQPAIEPVISEKLAAMLEETYEEDGYEDEEDYDDEEYEDDDDESEDTPKKRKKKKSKKKTKKQKVKIKKSKVNTSVDDEDEAEEHIEKEKIEETSDEDEADVLNTEDKKKTPRKGNDDITEELVSDEVETKKEEVAEQITEEELASYDRKRIKKVFRKYRVKRDHRMVMVDRCDKLSIQQTPAYIWVADNAFHLLLIEKEPRHIEIPIFKVPHVTYMKKQIANEDIDYAAFKGKSMLAELFRPYLPDYVHSTVVDDLSAYKNLYGIGPDIYFTNRSIGNVFDLLAVDFVVDDKVTMSPKVNTFFKEAYKSNILLRDNVVDANGYANRISATLDAMAHSTISYAEFKDTLGLMQKNKLITAEFAEHYITVREKLMR